MIHLNNNTSPSLTACGLGVFKQDMKGVYPNGQPDLVVTCVNCKRSLLYRGDNTNAIAKLSRRKR